MKKSSMLLTLLLMLSTIFVLISTSPAISKSNQPIASIRGITVYIERGPIKIFNNSAFGLYSFDGSGTVNDPYLIDNYNITSSSDTLIHIENTTAYFKINSTLLDCLGSMYAGIFLRNVIHGTIENNTICNSSDMSAGISIYLYSSSNNIISNNTIFNSTCGIMLDAQSSYNVLSNNTLHDCLGLCIGLTNDNNYNIISHNTIYSCTRGIQIQNYSHINNISNNIIHDCSEYGLYLTWYCSNNSIRSNTVYNCLINGLHLINTEISTISENIIYNCSNNGINLVSSNNNDLSRNTIYSCFNNGIVVDKSDSNTLSVNRIYNISTNGVVLDGSSRWNSLLGNVIFNCSNNGIDFKSYSRHNSISYNIIYNNTKYGLHFYDLTSNNTVVRNNFLDNNQTQICQVYDSGTNNAINHNYWNEWTTPDVSPVDGIVDNPYPIVDGSNTDPTPLINPQPPLVTIISPLEFHKTNKIPLILSGSAIQFWYYIEVVDSQNNSWKTKEELTLADGAYTLHAYGNDSLGSLTHISMIFTLDTIVPTVNIQSPVKATYNIENITLEYTVSEGVVSVYINGVVNTTNIPSGRIITGLQDGEHNFTIIAVDQAGNIGRDTIIFTIDTPDETTSDTTPKVSSFPGIIIIILFCTTMIFVFRRKT